MQSRAAVGQKIKLQCPFVIFPYSDPLNQKKYIILYVNHAGIVPFWSGNWEE